MGFFTALLGAIAASEEASKKRKRSNLEKEMDFYGLDESEREWVRKGDYDPSAFEEEDLGEEDYYYDDTEDD
jgi:hypothetical protein